MLIELKSLQPNPMRDFTIDPIDDDRVKELTASIKEDGFWGGVVCRRTTNNRIQIAAGHHRIIAAMKSGIREADVFAGNLDDAAMIRIYARENALQRGNTGTALAGSVAAAVRFLAKSIFTGGTLGEISQRSLDTARGQITTDKGIGWSLVLDLLEGTSGINEGTVKQQLANLKSSGDYARIIREVQEQIEQENEEALKALARAEAEQKKLQAEREAAEAREREAEERRKEAAKAAKAAKEEADRKRAEAEAQRAELARQKAEAEAKLAAKRKSEADEEMKKFEKLKKARDTAKAAAEQAESREKTFDFEGVARHLRNASHIDVFRQLATAEGVRPYLPVNQQAALAKKIVESVGELHARSIRENFMSMLMDVKQTERRINTKEKAELIKENWSENARIYQEDMARHARNFLAVARSLAEHNKNRPRGVTLKAISELHTAVQNIERAVVLIRKDIL